MPSWVSYFVPSSMLSLIPSSRPSSQPTLMPSASLSTSLPCAIPPRKFRRATEGGKKEQI
eukprot:9784199-Ditylum_brightwellii.AAC.1